MTRAIRTRDDALDLRCDAETKALGWLKREVPSAPDATQLQGPRNMIIRRLDARSN